MDYHTALKAIPAVKMGQTLNRTATVKLNICLAIGLGQALIRLYPTQTQMSLLRVERILLAHEASIPHLSIEIITQAVGLAYG
jgi:hypothetical protein